ncbi:MAG: hypothetical protein KDD50_11610 [Bdellovibrionales bacterium]|nr:hypothetical protein [Bdellovibrionales bacterium]
MKIYKYHPVVIKVYWGLVVTLLFAELITLRVHIHEIMLGTLLEALVKIVVVSAFIFTTLFRLFIFVRPRVLSTYQIEDENLLIKFKNKEKKINFAEIKKISILLFSPRFFGGFKIELNSGGKFYFLSLLRDNHEILQSILQHNPELLSQPKLERYIKVSRYVGRSWLRMREAIKTPVFYIHFFVIPVVLLALSYGESINWFYLTLGFMGFLFIFYNWVEEKLILRKIELNEPEEDLIKIERHSYWISLFLYYGLIVSFIFIFFKIK